MLCRFTNFFVLEMLKPKAKHGSVYFGWHYFTFHWEQKCSGTVLSLATYSRFLKMPSRMYFYSLFVSRVRFLVNIRCYLKNKCLKLYATNTEPNFQLELLPSGRVCTLDFRKNCFRALYLRFLNKQLKSSRDLYFYWLVRYNMSSLFFVLHPFFIDRAQQTLYFLTIWWRQNKAFIHK